ncbi:MAG: hypothetical protein AB1502_14125 [Thermodesulfobacteriota bacterium]
MTHLSFEQGPIQPPSEAYRSLDDLSDTDLNQQWRRLYGGSGQRRQVALRKSFPI